LGSLLSHASILLMICSRVNSSMYLKKLDTMDWALVGGLSPLTPC
jgi:hypothetical protein